MVGKKSQVYIQTNEPTVKTIPTSLWGLEVCYRHPLCRALGVRLWGSDKTRAKITKQEENKEVKE